MGKEPTTIKVCVELKDEERHILSCDSLDFTKHGITIYGKNGDLTIKYEDIETLNISAQTESGCYIALKSVK